MPAAMKKLILFLFMLIIAPVQSAQIANVEYIHTAIADKWDITIPYNREITNVGVVANMKYLLTAVDVANEILNGEKTTDYGNGEFATMVAADTVATDTAVETLVKKEIEYKFFMTTIPNTDSFDFAILATGEYYVDWGDGKTETIKKSVTDSIVYKHDYDLPGEYTVKLGGQATGGYISMRITFTIATANNNKISKATGCLGCIFPTLSDGSQPNFASTFYRQDALTEISAELFNGVYGRPGSTMFGNTFAYCTSLKSIPDGLFNGLSGKLNLSTFGSTFDGCTGLTGPSARINGKYLYEIWPDAKSTQVGSMYCGAEGLDDWDNIPDAWKCQ